MSENDVNALLERFALAQTAHGRIALQTHVLMRRLFWSWILRGPVAVKRGMDIIFSLAAIVLLSPVLALICLLIKLEDGGPVFFIQKRVGQFGREFKMLKFRSMCLDAEQRLAELLACNQHKEGVTFKIKDDPRITTIGRWLRKFSMDELPQFFNVLVGDMSLVGPRPPVPREVAKYSLADRRRLATKPGITCIWQISGRSEIDFCGQVQLDVRYIETQSFWCDFKIVAATVPAVLSGKGAC
jgi:exopolysaccharide biosynthesis polyprenyl glycosylphosphotransferase